MTGSVALDILIGLFTLYFVMSTLSSALVELIGNILALRAKMLKSFLEFQFYKTAYQNPGSLSESINNFRAEISDAIARLTQQGGYESNTEKFALDIDKLYQLVKAKPPSPLEILPFGKKLLHSIDSDNFAQTLNVLIGLTGDRDKDIPALYQRTINNFQDELTKPNSTDLDVNKVFSDLKNLISASLDEITREADPNARKQSLEKLRTAVQTQLGILRELVKNKFPQFVASFDVMNGNIAAIDRMIDGVGFDALEAKFENLKTLVDTLPSSQIKNVLITSIQQTEKKADQAEKTINDVSVQVAKWFDGEMTRLSDIYKRRSQFFLFFVGLLVAFLLNVNTIDIADALAKNPALREAVVEQARTITSKPGPTDPKDTTWSDALEQLNKLALPIGANACPVPPAPPNKSAQPFANPVVAETAEASATAEVTATPEATATAEATATPTPGTNPTSDNTTGSTGTISPSIPLSCNDPRVHWIGILITAAAAALGAPFWFDLLKSLTSRAAGSKTDAATKT